MSTIRRVLVSFRGRPLTSRFGLRDFFPPIAQSSRSLSTALPSPKSPSKWPKRVLILASIIGTSAYLFRLPPQRKEQFRLQTLGRECLEKGDSKEAVKYFRASFESVEELLTPRERIQEACMYAALCEQGDQHEAALVYYQTAMKSLKALNPLSVRCIEGLKLICLLAHSYHKTGRYDEAEKAYKKAARLYERYRNEFSANESSSATTFVLNKLDVHVIAMFVCYAQLLLTMGRDHEVSHLRQRVVQIVRNSSLMQANEERVLDSFDDSLALYRIQEERRRKKEGRDG